MLRTGTLSPRPYRAWQVVYGVHTTCQALGHTAGERGGLNGTTIRDVRCSRGNDDRQLRHVSPVTGGSGPYAGASGVQSEVNLGFNATDGVNFTFEVRLADA